MFVFNEQHMDCYRKTLGEYGVQGGDKIRLNVNLRSNAKTTPKWAAYADDCSVVTVYYKSDLNEIDPPLKKRKWTVQDDENVMDEVSLNNKFIVTFYSDVMRFDLVNDTSIQELDFKMKRHGKFTSEAVRQVFRNYVTPQNPVGNLGNNVKRNFFSDFDYVSKLDLDQEITKIPNNIRIPKQKKIPNKKLQIFQIQKFKKITKHKKSRKFQKWKKKSNQSNNNKQKTSKKIKDECLLKLIDIEWEMQEIQENLKKFRIKEERNESRTFKI